MREMATNCKSAPVNHNVRPSLTSIFMIATSSRAVHFRSFHFQFALDVRLFASMFPPSNFINRSAQLHACAHLCKRHKCLCYNNSSFAQAVKAARMRALF